MKARIERVLAGKPAEAPTPSPPPRKPPSRKPTPVKLRVITSPPRAVRTKVAAASKGTAPPADLAERQQAQRREAQAVLNQINLLGGAHRCYDCPHEEEAHVDGICLRCWDKRTRQHPFRSFLAGAGRFFADQALALPLPEQEETESETEMAAVG